MANRFRNAMDAVKATEHAKYNTKIFLAQKRKCRPKSIAPLQMRVAFAAVALVVVAIAGWQSWIHAVSFISVDVNPSIELSLNRWDAVVAVRGFGDSSVVFEQLPLTGKKYDRAVGSLLSAEKAQGLIAQDALVSFTVRADDLQKQKILMDNLSQYVDTALPGVQVECEAVDAQLWAEAHSHNLSAGRYRAIRSLMEVDAAASVEGCRNHSMRELQTRYDACAGHGMQRQQQQQHGHGGH